METMKNILGKPGAIRRMWLSADTSNWKGLIIRAYLTCVVWNMQRRCSLRALGQFVSSVYVMRNLFDFIAKVGNALSLNEEGKWLPE